MRQIGVARRGKTFTLLLNLIFIAGSLTLNFLNNDFAKTQLSDYAKSNPEITSATLAWPRLISEENDLATFNSRLSTWQVKSNFLIFRQMRDKAGVKYILIADKNYQSYFVGQPKVAPKRCDQSICQGIAVSRDGVTDINVGIKGLEIVDTLKMADDLPIPADFGLDKDVSLLITPMLDQLSTWQPFRYLPATYGWQIRASNSSLTATKYQQELQRLETALRGEFANVALNYEADRLSKLIGFEGKISSLYLHYLLTALFIFLLCLLIIWQRFKIKAVTTYLPFIAFALIIQGVWGFSTLLQLLIYALLFGACLFVINRFLDAYLLNRDFQSLALFRSSLLTLLSITALIGVFSSIIFSASQYLMRTEQIRSDLIDQQSPLDYTLKIGKSLSRPLDLGSLDELKALSNGGQLVPVIRSAASLIDKNGDEIGVNLIAKSEPLLDEPSIPIGMGKRIEIAGKGIADQIDLIIWLKNQSGAHYSVVTTGKASRTGVIPVGRVGENFIVGFELRLNPDYATTAEHALAESTGRSFEILNGKGQILSVNVDGKGLPIDDNWPIKSFSYEITDSPFILRPALPAKKVNLLVSDDLKVEINQLKLSDDLLVEVNKVEKGEFVGAEKPYAVIDLATYQSLLATTSPYALDPLEIWVVDGGNNFAQSFETSKFASLKLISRDKLIATQENSPYWLAWQRIFLVSLLLLLFLLIPPITYLSLIFNKDRKNKDWEFVNYFNAPATSIKPLIALLTLGTPLGIFLLLISRVIASLLS